MKTNLEVFYDKLELYETELKDEYGHDANLLQLIERVKLKSQFYFKPVGGVPTLVFFKDSEIPEAIQQEVILLYRLCMHISP